MGKWLLGVAQVMFVINANAQIKWDGDAGDGSWVNPLNWVGDQLPGAGTQVILDNSIVSGNYTVSLPSGNIATSIGSLIIAPATGGVITLINPNSNTSATALHATDPGDAIVLNDGAVFINSSGASSGTPVSVTSTNFFRINNGARYIHRTSRGHTDFLASRLSNAAGTEQGIFEFDVPGTASYTISGSNRTYGCLVFSAQTAGATRTYTSSGTGPIRINGDFTIGSNVNVSYGANTNNIIIHGNCIINTGGLFNISNGANNSLISIKGNLFNGGTITETGTSTGSTLEMSGSSTQTVSFSGSILQSVQFTINNPAGVSLLTDLLLPYRLQLVKGKIVCNPMQTIILADNAVCTGASSESFVEGPVKKIGDDDFTFPIGKGAIYSPIGISGTGNTNDAYTAEYFRSSPHTTPGLGSIYQSPIHHISFVEFWRIERNTGNSDKTIQLFVSSASFASQLNSLRVARHESGTWWDEGGQNYQLTAPAPPYVTGSFNSSAVISNFGYFTLGTTESHVVNPLPIELLSILAFAETDRQSRISWQMASGDYNRTQFEILRSVDGIQFFKIGECKGGWQSQYQYTDKKAFVGLNYYQLRIVDSIGEIKNSKVMTVLHHAQGAILKTVYSNIVREKLSLSIITGKKQDWEFILVDAMGRVWRRQKIVSSTEQMTLDISVSELGPGVYFVYLAGRAGNSNIVRIIKE